MMYHPPDADLQRLIRSIRLLAFDFDGVFTDNMVYVTQEGVESVRCTRLDGLGLSKLRALGLDVVIISTEVNPVVAMRARKLKTECIHGVEDKRAVMDKVLAEKGLTLEQAAFVGNDINDLPVLNCVGMPIVVHDAHPDVLEYGRYRTRTPGGHGAVREVCDLFAHVLESESR